MNLLKRWFLIKEYRNNYFIWWTNVGSKSNIRARHAEYANGQMTAIYNSKNLLDIDRRFLRTLPDPPFVHSDYKNQNGNELTQNMNCLRFIAT